MIIIQMMGGILTIRKRVEKGKDKWKGLKKQRKKVCIGIDNITEENTKEFLSKHKQTIELIEKYPNMKNIELFKLGEGFISMQSQD